MMVKSKQQKGSLDREELPLVSVVTPSLNQASFIESTINSVMEQDYPRIEYWVIDGGSDDGTVDILRSYENDPRFNWISEADTGQAEAVNKGWALATGEILAWINSDDTYLEGAISTQVDALLAHPEAGLVYGSAQYIDEKGEVVGRYHSRPYDPIRLLHLPYIPQPTIFIRRRVFDEFGGPNSNLKFALDYDFILRLLWRTDFVFIDKNIATYRIHTRSKTSESHQAIVLESIESVQQICAVSPMINHSLEKKVLADWYWSAALISLDLRLGKQTLEFISQAIRHNPFRPRLFMFLIKLFDRAFMSDFYERAVTFLDNRARGNASS